MHLFWVLIATSVVVGVDARACAAQASTGATIKAKVRAAPPSRPRGPRNASAAVHSQTASLVGGPSGSRAQLRTSMGERMTIELEGAASSRVRLLVTALEARADAAPIECRWRVEDPAPRYQPHELMQTTCEELVIRWPDSPTWPALLSIAGSVSADGVHPRRAVAHFTIVAVY